MSEEPGRQPPVTEAEAREHAMQLRAAPAEQVVAELIFTVLNAAQTKLGRKDARLLIDMAAGMAGHSRTVVSEDMAKQVDEVLAQLRLAQVHAEEEVAHGEPEPNDLTVVPPPPDAAREAEQPRQTSRLWVPGQ